MANTQYSINNGQTQSVFVNGELTLTKLSGATIANLTTLIIGSGVTSIGTQAFQDCTKLTSVTIGSGVNTIGNYAFQDCTNLTTLIIGSGVQTIGMSAFKRCTKLTTVTIGSSVQSIGMYAFQGCKMLTTVIIPDSVQSIGTSVFWNCFLLTSVTFGGPIFTFIDTDIFYGIALNATCIFTFLNTISENQINASLLAQIKFITNDDTVSISGPQIFISTNITTNTQYSINNGQTQSVFVNGELTLTKLSGANISNLTTLIIGSSVQTIGTQAFYDCAKLTSVTIPNSVTSIGSYAFQGCTTLTSVTIPDSVNTIGNNAFQGCTTLTSVTIPDSVNTIGNNAFQDCTKLTTVTIGSGVQSIGTSVFYNCFLLTSVTFGGPIFTFIGTNIFYGIASYATLKITFLNTISEFQINTDLLYQIKSITNDDTVSISGPQIFISTNITTNTQYSINNGQTQSVFVNGELTLTKLSGPTISNLTTLIIGSSVTGFVTSAFKDCTKLTSVTIGSGVLDIGVEAFRNCTALISLTIPNSVKTIGNRAFYGCTSLTPVTIPDSVLAIGNNAFQGCNKLTSVIIGSGVKSIGDNAFQGCTKLTSVTIGSGVQTIGTQAFYNCIGLTTISWTNPLLLTSINSDAFNNCTKITDVYYNNTVTGELLPSVLQSYTYGSSNPTLHHPYIFMTYTQYLIVGSSTLLSAQVNGELKLSDLGAATATTLTTLIIGTAVTIIGQGAFSACGSLVSVFIPVDVTTIGQGAFSACGSLTYINIPAGVTSIGMEAFYSCTSLVSIDFPDSVTNIGRSMFNYCTSLESVTIPNSVTSIDYLAFGLCSSLASVTFGGPLTNANINDQIVNYIGSNNTRKFTFLNTNSETQINPNLLAQIKSITDDDTVSSTGPQIFISTNISSGTELLVFLATNNASDCYINNDIVVTKNLINTSNTPKILMNNTNTPITIKKI